MSELAWFELHPPRDVDLEAVTALIRPLAARPRWGLPRTTPLVVFEMWSFSGAVRWLLGMDARLAGDLPAQLRAHLPRLGMTSVADPQRPALTLGATVRLEGMAFPLRPELAGAVSAALQSAMTRLGKDEAAAVQWVLGPAQPRTHAPLAIGMAEALGLRERHVSEATAEKLFRDKAAEPLLAAQGRIGAQAGDSRRAGVILRGLASALTLVSSEHASLRISRTSCGMAERLYEVIRPALTWSAVLSASEVAAVIGWPVQDEVPEALPVIGGAVNLVPRSLLAAPDDDHHPVERVLGASLHPSQRGRLVTMPPSSASHHVHVIGPTGSGKSTLLCGLILADIAAGRGCLVVEPRGDLVADVLARIPQARHEDVVVIDPGDAAAGLPVVGINVLSGPLETAERRADELVGLLAAMHGANFGPRTSDIALHAILTASKLEDGTLADVIPLLTNPAFRRQTISQVADPMVLSPWWAWFEAQSEQARAQIIAPLSNKLRAFQAREQLRWMVGQAAPKFNVDDLFGKRRIVLVNLNRGLLGAPTANLLGALILSCVWSALQRRAALPREQRQVVGLFVDEFQDYVDVTGGLDFGDLLAQARGLGGALTVAHQHLGQLSSGLEAAVIANARSRITFRPATDDAKALASTFAARLTAEDLLRLRAYEAVAQLHVDGQPTLPFAVKTRPLGPFFCDPVQLRRASAERYGVAGAAVDAALQERWNRHSAGSGRIGVKSRRAGS